MSSSQDKWSESDSKLYREIATVAVPAREQQIATLLTLLPFRRHDSFKTVELGCGDGVLAYALLDSFPRAEVIALDGSEEMRVQATERLTAFGPRARVDSFDLAATNTWLSQVQAADCAISSLCLHHLSREEKQNLFVKIANRLSFRGVFLIADLIEPQRPEARELFAATWDRLAQTQSIAETGSPQLFEKFVETEWNYYRFGNSIDQPSPLFDQLTWLKVAGFEVVDCFWLQAGHAIYGGYKTRMAGEDQATYQLALRTAQAALRKK